MLINIKVKPNSSKQEVKKLDEENYVVCVKSKPENNKANLEVVKLMEKYFNKEVRILRGKTSRKKVVDIK